MAESEVISVENIDALLNSSMDAEEGPAGDCDQANIELMEDALLGQDNETEEGPPKTDVNLAPERDRSDILSNMSAETQIVEGTVGEVEVKDCIANEEKFDPVPKEEQAEEEVEPSAPETVTVAEDDVIILDDEDEDDQSGVSDSKKARKDVEDEIMEIDENDVLTSEEKKSVGNFIRKMGRQDLEDLVLAKIVEAVVAHTEVGQLRGKVLELQMQKDKMAMKLGTMMKQVAELSSAVKLVVENETRDPNNRIGKPHVIRFNRSVGLQTSIEPSVRSAPPKIIRVPEPAQNGVRQYGSNAGKTTVYAGANGTFKPPQVQGGVKRAYAGNKTGETKTTASSASAITSPRNQYGSAPPPRMYPIAPKPVAGVTSSPPATLASQNVQPGIVDLTDDDPPPTSLSAQNVTTSVVPRASVPATTIINGVQYHIVNRTAAPGVQIISPGTQAQKYIATPTSGQTRPVLLQQLAVGTSAQRQLSSNQPTILQGVNNPSGVIMQRPGQQRQVGVVSVNGAVPRVAATVSSGIRGGNNTVLGTSSVTARFVLPPLPNTPTSKVKNDIYKAPPKPELTLKEQTDGIVLSWSLPTITNMAEVTTYQLFACQESLTNNSNRPSQWKRVGDVKALPLPMACTLSQFTEENRYYFIVRGIDVYGRVGPFCDPQNIILRKKK